MSHSSMDEDRITIAHKRAGARNCSRVPAFLCCENSFSQFFHKRAVLDVITLVITSVTECYYIMPPIPPMPGAPPGIGASGSGLSVTRVSVVSTIAAMDAAFWSAERVTFAGSTMPAPIMST